SSFLLVGGGLLEREQCERIAAESPELPREHVAFACRRVAIIRREHAAAILGNAVVPTPRAV
ncbi:MAG: hypothetical protein WCI61_10465, partial [Chloroflexota bacterium]